MTYVGFWLLLRSRDYADCFAGLAGLGRFRHTKKAVKSLTPWGVLDFTALKSIDVVDML